MSRLTTTLSHYWDKIQASLFPWLTEELRYNERTTAERANARLKDEFGANKLRVRGHAKAACHLMFGVLVLAADQLMKLAT